MAKLTLLQMTQDILNDMDGDNINAIDDTEESLQVAQIIKTTYFNLVSQRDWAFLRALSSLEGLGDTNNPTKMKIAENVNKILWLKYNKKDVVYKEPKDFLDLIQSRDTTAPEVDANGYRIDKDPSFWTSYDDQYVIFDSRDDSVDTTLQESNSDVWAVTSPTWLHEDDFIPTLPEKDFPVLLAAAKSACFILLKQTSNPVSDSYAVRGVVRMQNEHRKLKEAEDPSNRIDYGRK